MSGGTQLAGLWAIAGQPVFVMLASPRPLAECQIFNSCGLTGVGLTVVNTKPRQSILKAILDVVALACT
jgi:hypothetical protein